MGRAVTLVDADGDTSTQVGRSQSFSASSSILEFSRHFIVDTSASATLAGSGSSQPYISGGQFKTATESSTTHANAFGFGNNEADKNELYKTSGIIRKDFRPVLTAQDGTVFYEVTTVSADATSRNPALPINRSLT